MKSRSASRLAALVQSFGYPALGLAAVVLSTASTTLFSQVRTESTDGTAPAPQ